MTIDQLIVVMKKAINDYFLSLSIVKSVAMGSIDVSNKVGGYAGFNMTATAGVFRDDGATHGFYRGGAVNAYLWYSDNTGRFTAKGDVANFSDPRLKKNWRIPDTKEAVAQLAALTNYGTYDRTDVEMTQVGADASQLKETFLAYGVSIGTDPDKLLSVAYGQCSMVGTIILAKYVKTLEERLTALEKKLN